MKKRKNAEIMGILNITPDSFSDGGKYIKSDAFKTRIEELRNEGADIIDIGGESTGPGSVEVNLNEELERVIPAIKACIELTDCKISLDTNKLLVAEEGLKAGASIINDVTGLRNSPEIAKLVAEKSGTLIIMYSKDNTPRTTISEKSFKDPIEEIGNFLKKKKEQAEEAGIKAKRIVIDPGMGHFISSKAIYSYEVISRLKELTVISPNILIGISRKSLLKVRMEERDKAALPLTAIAYLNGASIIRTHQPGMTKEFIKSLLHA